MERGSAKVTEAAMKFHYECRRAMSMPKHKNVTEYIVWKLFGHTLDTSEPVYDDDISVHSSDASDNPDKTDKTDVETTRSEACIPQSPSKHDLNVVDDMYLQYSKTLSDDTREDAIAAHETHESDSDLYYELSDTSSDSAHSALERTFGNCSAWCDCLLSSLHSVCTKVHSLSHNSYASYPTWSGLHQMRS